MIDEREEGAGTPGIRATSAAHHAATPRAHRPLRPGTHVEVRSDFDGSWQPGFVVASAAPAGYVLRRDGDDALLPPLPVDRVRRPRRRETWWL